MELKTIRARCFPDLINKKNKKASQKNKQPFVIFIENIKIKQKGGWKATIKEEAANFLTDPGEFGPFVFIQIVITCAALYFFPQETGIRETISYFAEVSLGFAMLVVILLIIQAPVCMTFYIPDSSYFITLATLFGSFLFAGQIVCYFLGTKDSIMLTLSYMIITDVVFAFFLLCIIDTIESRQHKKAAQKQKCLKQRR